MTTEGVSVVSTRFQTWRRLVYVFNVMSEESIHCQVLDLYKTVHVLGNGVESNQEVMLAFIVIMNKAKPFESCIGETFVIVSPANAFIFKKVDYRRHVLVD